MGMNEWLANVYDTNGARTQTQSAEGIQKYAQAELFCKLAAKHGVDLSKLSSEQMDELYTEVFPKEAAEAASAKLAASSCEKCGKAPCECKKEEEKKAEAAMAHFQDKLAAQEKFKEADLMGRVMAHSFHDELNQIKTAGGGFPFMPGGGKPDDKKDDKGDDKGPPPKDKKDDKDKDEEKKASPFGLAKNANAHAFEELAARRAVDMAKEAKYDEAQAQQRIGAVFTLGLEESDKVAAAGASFEQGLQIRALEYLEKAGYEVDWKAVFGE